MWSSTWCFLFHCCLECHVNWYAEVMFFKPSNSVLEYSKPSLFISLQLQLWTHHFDGVLQYVSPFCGHHVKLSSLIANSRSALSFFRAITIVNLFSSRFSRFCRTITTFSTLSYGWCPPRSQVHGPTREASDRFTWLQESEQQLHVTSGKRAAVPYHYRKAVSSSMSLQGE